MAVSLGVICVSLVRNSDYSREKINTDTDDRVTRIKYRLKRFNLIKYLGPAFIISVAYIDPADSL